MSRKGYKLERGELHTKKEHLSVEEYKVTTKYEDLKKQKEELERLEEIDKQALYSGKRQTWLF